MRYEEAQAALLAIARRNKGLITADEVEGAEGLSADPDTVSAAALALASSTNVFATARESGGWFPYSEIRITEL